MTQLTLLFSIPYSYSLFFVMFVALAALCTGLLYKRHELQKTKSKILRLENEKLSNHSRILKLERKLAELQNETAKNKAGLPEDLEEKKIGQQYNAA